MSRPEPADTGTWPRAARSRYGSLERAVAKVLLATALLPTGPLLGLGVPPELGFPRWRDGALVRVSSLELAAGRLGDAAAAIGHAAARARWSEAAASLRVGSVPSAREVETVAQAQVPDPSDPYGLRERPGARGAGAEVPPPPSPPDFSLLPKRAPSRRDAARPAPAGAGGVATPEVSVPVRPRWNLLSISWTPGDPAPAAVLAPIAGAYQRVYAFDACDPVDPWKRFLPADPGSSDLAAISPALGFWLEGTGEATLPEAGPEPVETEIPLCPGWNLVGFPSSASRPVAVALAPIAGKYLRVFGFDAADGEDPWEVYDPAAPAWASDLQELRPGRGYWIYATEAATLTISNASDGPTVALLAPLDLEEVTAPAEVVATVRSPSLAGWELDWRAEGDPEWLPLASGATPVEAQPLATFDPTLLENGLYELRLSAADTLGRIAEQVVDIVVDGQMKIGHFALTFADLEVPLAGLPIQVLRSYDSRRKDRPGDFGFGWTLEIRQGSLVHNRVPGEAWRIASGVLPCQQAVELAPHLSTVRLTDREIYRFRPVLSQLAVTGGGCFARVSYQLVDGPVPGATLEVLGNASVYWANGETRLVDSETLELFQPARVRMTTRDGRLFELERGVGVTRLIDANGNALDFSPQGIAHSSGASITFERDGEGRIERILDPSGGELLYAYDGAGDLVASADRSGAMSEYRYLPGHRLEEIRDPLGRIPIRNEYGPDGRLTRHVDAYGHEIVYEHRIGERLEVVTDRLGASRSLHYDARGNVVREVDETGIETERSFDADDQLLSEAIGGLPATEYAYDGARNLTSVLDPLGHVTSFTYDDRGNVLTSTDPNGRVTAHVYDARGNLIQTSDPAGNLATYTFDARGNLLAETDPGGAVTRYSYDARGNLVAETDALGNEATFAYDALGNRLSETRNRTRADGSPETLVTLFVYDAAGRLVESIAPDGSSTATEYDALGQVTATIDPLGRRTEIAYDDLGRPIRTEHPDGTFEETEYDAEGRRTAVRDRAGRWTELDYDPAGRLLRTRHPDGAEVEQRYDGAGRLEATIDARGVESSYAYDSAGRRTRVADALGQVTTFGYDAAGNQTRVTDPRGLSTTFLHDALGRLVRTVFPDGTTRRTEYDALGRRVAEIDEAGVRTDFGYDALGRLTAVTDALGQVTSYAYDELGNRISQTDANGHTTRFEYDALGRQTARILPDGAAERFTYDLAGNRKTRSAFDGALTRYTYDSNHRLVRRDYPDGSFHGFAYTATGRRRLMVDARGVTTYEHDLRDRVTAIAYPDGRALGFAYDAAGNRTALTAHVDGRVLTTAYTYDELGRLETVTDPDGGVYVHAYDANGNRASLAHPNGVVTSYAYDARNRLLDLTAVDALGQTIVSFAYTLAPTGNRARIREQDGTTRHYQYDPLYRLIDEHVRTTGAPDAPTLWRNAYAYDPVGNRLRQDRTELSGVERVVDYAYDARDRLTTESSGGATNYGWDANGNQTTRSGPEGTTHDWDYENRLTRVALASGALVEHTYDADGTRIRTRTTPATGPPTTVDYLVDPWHQTSAAGRALVLSQVVAETDGDGALTALHVRGDDLLATLRPAGPDAWTPRYFHAEGIGTIRALTDAQGQVTDRYTLEAFGTLLDHQGTDPNPYLFAAEPLDPNSGFYYNRARWLEPNHGRFTSIDPWPGRLDKALTLHKYLYADACPPNRCDPSGLMSLPEISISNLVQRTLDVMKTIPLRVAQRIASGTSGNFWRALGRWAESNAYQVLRLYAQQFQNLRIVRAVAYGASILDFTLALGSCFAVLEVKYGLPHEPGGGQMGRLRKQGARAQEAIDRAAASGKRSQFVLWTMKEPNTRQVRITMEALGEVGRRTQFVHGVRGLASWLWFFFGPC